MIFDPGSLIIALENPYLITKEGTIWTVLYTYTTNTLEDAMIVTNPTNITAIQHYKKSIEVNPKVFPTKGKCKECYSVLSRYFTQLNIFNNEESLVFLQDLELEV
jgi:hypothetical protein